MCLLFLLLLHAGLWLPIAPTSSLLTPQSLMTVARSSSLHVETALRDITTGTTAIACTLTVQTAEAHHRLHLLCLEQGLQLCVSTDEISSPNEVLFMGVKVPKPCVKVNCQNQPSNAVPWNVGTVAWHGRPGPMNPSRSAVVVHLSLQHSSTVVLLTSNPTFVVPATLPPDASASPASLLPTTPSSPSSPSLPQKTSPSNGIKNTNETNDTMKLLIDFPPPNAQIWSDDVRISTVIEVDDAMEFSKQRDTLRACFLLEQVYVDEVQPDRGVAVGNNGHKMMSFCDELDVSVLRFKGLNNGMYRLTLWMVEVVVLSSASFESIDFLADFTTSGAAGTVGGTNNVFSYRVKSDNTTRMFEIKNGSTVLDEWMIDPRVNLSRTQDPTTLKEHRGWPCSSSSSSSQTQQTQQENDEQSLIPPTSKAAIPWLNEHQLTIPSYPATTTVVPATSAPSSATTSPPKPQTRIWPSTSYAWEHEYTTAPIVLVVGIKVEADAFEYRDIIRKTWMSAVAKDVKAWFIVGIPSAKHSPTVLDRILLEAQTHQDMLLGEHPYWARGAASGGGGLNVDYPWMVFHVHDSYYTLVQKTMTFLEFTMRTYPNHQYLMIVDNDVYLRLSNLTHVLRSPSMQGVQKFFAGQVWQSQYGRPLRPQRDVDLKNYLPWKLWPNRDFPPVAIGPHYLMSSDCVAFLTKNKQVLRGVGTLEDVSISVWLRAYGVVPEHVKWFSNAKNFGCVEGVVSLSDLSVEAIALIHSNVVQELNFCQGLDGMEEDEKRWWKANESSIVKEEL